MSSTLYSISCKIGRAIGLPAVFYKSLPLPKLLETRLELSAVAAVLTGRGRKGRQAQARKRRRHGGLSVRQVTLVLEGQIDTGSTSKFAINKTDFFVTAGTWIIGELRVGASARVKGSKNPEGVFEAASIVVLG